MSQTAVVDQTFASGRYSKRKRTQVTYFMDEMDVSDAESDFDEVQTKKRKTASPKRLPKSKIFPFMDLPAEIRNMIYTYTLVDPSGMNLVATFKHKRRTVERISAEAQDSIKDAYSYYSSSRINDDLRARFQDPIPLTPSLLAVSKQIHEEARDIFYANDFIFTDTFALYSFLINLGPSGAKHLKTMRLMGWGFGRAMKGYNHACFAVLAWATNLTKFTLDKTTRYNRSANGAAEQIYRDAFPWMEAVGTARGKADAVLDVPDVPEEAFEHLYTVSDHVKDFREVLRKLLVQQQKRVLATPTKKRKTLRKDEL